MRSSGSFEENYPKEKKKELTPNANRETCGLDGPRLLKSAGCGSVRKVVRVGTLTQHSWIAEGSTLKNRTDHSDRSSGTPDEEIASGSGAKSYSYQTRALASLLVPLFRGNSDMQTEISSRWRFTPK
jgi:hypothetical protein